MRNTTPAGSRPLRTVLVSAVRHASDYAEMLVQHPGIDLVAVAEDADAGDLAWEAATSASERLSLPLRRLPEERESTRWFTDLDADLAVICSEPTRHAALAIRALHAGMHVLVDKPVATTRDDARRVIDAADSTGRRCAVVTRALLPPVLRVRSWVEEGRLGLPRSIDIEFLASGRDFATTVERPELVVSPALSGGGELMNFLGYAVDQARVITGCEPVEIYCETGALFSSVHAQHGVEDVGLVSMLMSNGVVASLTVGRVPVVPGPGFATSTLRVVGSHGHAELDTEASALRRFDLAGDVQDVPIHGSDRGAFNTVLDALLRGITADEALPYGAGDAAVAVATIEAAYSSARASQPVQVEVEGLLR